LRITVNSHSFKELLSPFRRLRKTLIEPLFLKADAKVKTLFSQPNKFWKYFLPINLNLPTPHTKSYHPAYWDGKGIIRMMN